MGASSMPVLRKHSDDMDPATRGMAHELPYAMAT